MASADVIAGGFGEFVWGGRELSESTHANPQTPETIRGGFAEFLTQGVSGGHVRSGTVHGGSIADAPMSSAIAAHAAIHLGVSECTPGVTADKNASAVCVGAAGMAAVRKIARGDHASDVAAMAAAKAATGCTSQACVLKKAASSGHL